MSKKGTKIFWIDPRLPEAEYNARVIEKLKSKTVVVESGCHEWTGFIQWNGYGFTSYRGKQWPVHRLLYTMLHGPIPKKIDCCHTCDDRKCLNPDHLWLGTRQENLMDASSKGRVHCQKKTHCPRGHEYSDKDRAGRNGWRNCRICGRARMRLRAGWPEDLAYSLEPVAHGYAPVGANWKHKRKAQ